MKKPAQLVFTLPLFQGILLFTPPLVVAVLAGLCVPCVQQRWDRGKGSTAPGQVPLWWARAVGAAGTCSTASAGEVPTSVCRLGHSAADKWTYNENGLFI